MNERLVVLIRGAVQGVGFRYAILDEAVNLRLTGFVRNEADGSVRVEAEGAKASLQTLLEWCRRGPPTARVGEISEAWFPARGMFQSFTIE